MPTNPIEGVIAPNLTPFNDDLTIAEDLYLAHADWLIGQGCAGLAPFGTTGEALSVGIDERIGLLEKLAARVDAAKLIPGTGLTNLPDTVRLTRHAVDLGCAGAMTLPPFYYKGVPDQGLYDYFSRLIEMVDRPALRIYLYHIPQVAGVGIPTNLVSALVQSFPDTIVGIKDSSGEWTNTAELLAIHGLIVYPGQELTAIPAHALGAPGCISATANLNPAKIARMIAGLHAGEDVGRLNDEVTAFRMCLQTAGPIPAQKALLARWTGDARWANLRPPLLRHEDPTGVLNAVERLPGFQRPSF